jgi:hypothetical protein
MIIARSWARPTLASASLLAVVAACSSSSSGSASGPVTGSIGGSAFAAADALAVVETLANSGTPPVSETDVAITSFAGACALATSGGGTPSGAAVVNLIVVGNGAALAKTYTIDGASVGVQYSGDFGSECKTTMITMGGATQTISSKAGVIAEATGGTITFTQVTSTMIEGSFDAMFPSGDHLSGGFTAAICNASMPGATEC